MCGQVAFQQTPEPAEEKCTEAQVHRGRLEALNPSCHLRRPSPLPEGPEPPHCKSSREVVPRGPNLRPGNGSPGSPGAAQAAEPLALP